MAGKHIKFDCAIKRLLRNKSNFDVLEGFMSELLMFDVRIVEILESESNQQSEDDKFNRVDILVKDIDDDLILIEVQNERQDDYYHRMVYGQAKLISERLDLGDEYGKLTKVYSINIVYFPLGVGKDYVYISDGSFRGLHFDDELELSEKQKKLYNAKKVKDLFTQYYIIKLNSFDDVAKTSLDEWIYFLKNSEIKDSFKAKGLVKAKDVLLVDNLSPEEKVSYDLFIKNQRIHQSEINSAKRDVEYEYEGKLKEAELEKENALKDKSEALKEKAEAEKREKEAQLKKVEAEKEKAEAEKREKEAQLKKVEAEKEKAEAEKREKESNIKLAKKMIKYNESIEDIMKETGMTEDEIKELISR